MEQHRYRSTNLAGVLDDQGRKRRWLAQRVGVSEALISKLISGERTVSADVAEGIASILGLPLFLLFELSESSKLLTEEVVAS